MDPGAARLYRIIIRFLRGRWNNLRFRADSGHQSFEFLEGSPLFLQKFSKITVPFIPESVKFSADFVPKRCKLLVDLGLKRTYLRQVGVNFASR